MCKSVFKIKPLLLFIGSTVTWQFDHPVFLSVCGYNFIAYDYINLRHEVVLSTLARKHANTVMIV